MAVSSRYLCVLMHVSLHYITFNINASQCSVDGDLSSLNIIAQSLLKLQMLFGIIPNVRSKGHSSKRVLQKLLSLRVEELEHEQQMLQQQQSALHASSKGAVTGHGSAGAGPGTGSAEDSKGTDGTINSSSSSSSNRARSCAFGGGKLVADKYNPRSEIDLLVM